VFDADGTAAGDVDLTAFAADDGNPEAATLAHAGDRLFVGLQQLDTRGAIWIPTGPGIVAELDCDALTTGTTWEVGPNPSLHEATDDTLVVRTGIWGEADGALTRLHVDGELDAPFATEAALGEDLGEIAMIDDVAVALTTSFDFGPHTVRCFAPDGSHAAADPIPNYLSAVVDGGDGYAWVAQSVDYADASAPTGVLAFDPVTCMRATDTLPTLLPPYALARY
jgi:hypothetical protein